MILYYLTSNLRQISLTLSISPFLQLCLAPSSACLAVNDIIIIEMQFEA